LHKSVTTLTLFVVIVLIACISSASAQTNETEMPMGDTWPSRESLIYVPRAAVMAGAMEEGSVMLEENSSPFQASITLKLKKTSSQHITPQNSQAVRLKRGKHSAAHARHRFQ